MNGTLEPIDKQPRSFRGNRAHLRRLVASLHSADTKSWDEWRKKNPKLRPDLRGLNLSFYRVGQVNLGEIDLSRARLQRARLDGLHLWDSRFDRADLREANLDQADLFNAHLKGADLRWARLIGTNLTQVDARDAKFCFANLSHAVMNGAYLQGAELRGAKVTGLSTWAVHVDSATDQKGLILEKLGDFLEDIVDDTDVGQKPKILGRFDHLEAVQVLYLIRDRQKLKLLIDAMTSNLVLILGSFTDGRKSILDSVADRLVTHGYAPVVFDFEAPKDRDLIETVALLAGFSCFIIADLTRPRSTPLEAMLVAPQLAAPFAPIIEKGEAPFAMFSALQAKYKWVRPIWRYRNKTHLLRELEKEVIDPCIQMQKRLRRWKREGAVSPRKRRGTGKD